MNTPTVVENLSLEEAKKLLHHWMANHKNLAERLRLFTQRHDLPVDRLPAYQHLIQLQEENSRLRETSLAQKPLLDLQHEVAGFVLDTFGDQLALDPVERGARFIEEALELIQATGITREHAHAMVDYVYDRPVGKVADEVGGAGITLMALANVEQLNVLQCVAETLGRAEGRIEKIREKNKAKPRFQTSTVESNED